MFEALSASASSLESKLMLYIIAGVVALVVVNLLLDGIRKYIRGLDTAALGGLLIWLGYKASQLTLVSVLTNLLYLVGGTLLASGILIFVIMMLFRRRRSAKRSGPPMPKHAQTGDKEKATDDSAAEKPAEEASEAK